LANGTKLPLGICFLASTFGTLREMIEIMYGYRQSSQTQILGGIAFTHSGEIYPVWAMW
jgi:hypothetical protein